MSRACGPRCRSSSSGRRVLPQVAHQADDVLGDEPADGAAGVDADDYLPGRVEDEAGGLQVDRRRVDERAGQVRDSAGVMDIV